MPLKTSLKLFVFICTSLTACDAFADATPPRIFSVKGLYGLERTNCNQQSNDQQAVNQSAIINKEFCNYFNNPNLTSEIGQYFANEIKANYSNVDDTFGQGFSNSINETSKVNRTLVASISISQADIWTVKKQSFVEVFMPITMRISFTNLLSGEVTYSYSLTNIVQGLSLNDNIYYKANEEIDRAIKSTIRQIVTHAYSQFTPSKLTEIQSKVIDKYDDKYLINKGVLDGIKEGDTISDTAKVVFSDANYSVVDDLLGNIKVGDTITKTMSGTVKDLSKPTIMVVVADYPDDYSKDYITGIYEERLGSLNKFSIVPVNPSFSEVRNFALASAKLQSSTINERILPDYFALIDIYTVPEQIIPTNIPSIDVRTAEAYVICSITNSAGNILFVDTQSVKELQQVTDGMSISPNQRLTIAINNAIQKSAEAITNKFMPTRAVIEIKNKNGKPILENSNGLVTSGAYGKVLRKVGANKSNIKGDIFIPVGDYSIFTNENNEFELSSAIDNGIKIKDGYLFSINTVKNIYPSNDIITKCQSWADTINANQLIPEYSQIIPNIFRSKLIEGYPVVYNDERFKDLAKEKLSQFSNSQKFYDSKPVISRNCATAVMRITDLNLNTNNKSQNYKYNIIMGYKLFSNGVQKSAKGISLPINGAAIPLSASQNNMNYILGSDVTEQLINNLKNLSKNLN